jgi:hypothetical protein
LAPSVGPFEGGLLEDHVRIRSCRLAGRACGQPGGSRSLRHHAIEAPVSSALHGLAADPFQCSDGSYL